MRYGWWLVLVAVLSGVSCGRDGGGSAGDAVKRQLDYVDKGQYGRQWDELHPVQQAMVPRELFVRCLEESLGGRRVPDIQVVSQFQEDRPLAGTSETVKGTAVTVRYPPNASGQRREDRETFYQVKVDGTWRWVMRDPSAYQQGRCPSPRQAG